ncbi:MAG: fructose-6-phosphate aldolase [Spirochaetales bacterium]|jgi:transaldolase|nr:fructose-6-phosphate aldolase [Spirochaetales bacterium]
MKLFLDTAFIEEIKQVRDWGLLDGVTTNPSHVAKTGASPKDLYPQICKIVDGPVSLEAVSLDADGIIKEARELAKIADNVVIKVPIMREGLIAVKKLKAEGIKTNVTTTFSALQALLAAKAGAAYISPFVGRLDYVGQRGMTLVEEIKKIYSNYGYKTEIIVAAIRHPMHVLESALIGADICTLYFDWFKMLYEHPMTDISIQNFLKDWEKVPK